jgi:AcrR family transcriptional regulator
MIEAVHKAGYTGTTVAHVIALAGVSRRAFYEQFANKEECFLATYDISVARSKKKVLDAWLTDRGWANRLHRSCQAFAEDAYRNAKGTRLVLIEGLGIGPRARERLLLASGAYERVIATAFDVAPDGIKLPPLAPRAIVGGGRYVTAARLRQRRESELPGLTDELLDWVSAYRSPAAGRLALSQLPNPPHVPPLPVRFLSGDDRRSRLLGAVVHLTLDEGFKELSDPQIAQFAGMSTESFHKQFADKEGCFLTVLDEFASELIEVMGAAAEQANAWPEAVYLGVQSAVDYMATHPGLVRMAFIDIFDVGPRMVDRLNAILERFVKLLEQGAPEPRRAPALSAEAVTGALWTVLSGYAVRNRLRYLPCLVDHLAFIVLAPYLGPKPAIETIERAKQLPQRRLSA